jgi:hypothetical protein
MASTSQKPRQRRYVVDYDGIDMPEGTGGRVLNISGASE